MKLTRHQRAFLQAVAAHGPLVMHSDEYVKMRRRLNVNGATVTTLQRLGLLEDAGMNTYTIQATASGLAHLRETDMKVNETIAKRASVYGSFEDNAQVAQAIKEAMRAHPGWAKLPDTLKEGLDLIALKQARMVTGDWKHIDNPHDIAGYALRMEEYCREQGQ